MILHEELMIRFDDQVYKLIDFHHWLPKLLERITGAAQSLPRDKSEISRFTKAVAQTVKTINSQIKKPYQIIEFNLDEPKIFRRESEKSYIHEVFQAIVSTSLNELKTAIDERIKQTRELPLPSSTYSTLSGAHANLPRPSENRVDESTDSGNVPKQATHPTDPRV